MKYVFANWKMYCGPKQSNLLAQELAGFVVPDTVRATIFPTALSCESVHTILHDSSWQVGAQNVAWVPDGAYTGAVSAQFFYELGARYALIGHSERRHIFHETDPDVRKKLEACLSAGLTPVLCLGETAEDKEAGRRQYRLKKQLLVALENLSRNGNEILFAYEPVWAITHSGSGEACTPADVVDVHGWLTTELREYGFTNPSILYGGSVTPDNVMNYASLPDVAGVLVGSASTRSASLLSIINAFRS